MHATNENAILRRSLFMKLFVKSYEYRHRNLFWGVRIVVGLELVVLGVILFSHRSWWGLLPLVGAAAAFLCGYRVYQLTGSTQPTGGERVLS